MGVNETGRTPRVLLRSSWQMANIGDMAHAPSAIGLLDRLAHDIEVVLWARRIAPAEQATLQRWYPRLRVILGELDESGRASTEELAEELERCTFLLHGSGRLLAGEPDVQRWSLATGKPYGFFGITVDPLSPTVTTTLADMAAITRRLGDGHISPERLALLTRAAFVYCRDSISVDYLARQGVEGPTVRFGPDAVFAFDPPAEDHGAAALRRRHGLDADGYVCIVPRLRYTPYHHMLGTTVGPAERLKDAVNATYRDRELGVLADAIIHAVRRMRRRVLICPEMTYAGALGAEMLAELPADVQASVSVMTEFWTPAEAMEVYAGAAAVVSMECHSPILAGRVGTPSIYLRQPTDTTKGEMWTDVGLADRIVELDDVDTHLAGLTVARFLDDAADSVAVTRERSDAAAALLESLTLEAADVIRRTASDAAAGELVDVVR